MKTTGVRPPALAFAIWSSTRASVIAGDPNRSPRVTSSAMGARLRVIDHIGVGVRDFVESLDFYTRALAPLGFERVPYVDADNRSAGFGLHGRDDFWIHEGRPVGRAHVAFDSESREAVDAFHAAALEAGARDNGAP